MNRNFYLTVKYDTDQSDMITISSNAKQNVENTVTSKAWVKCEESERFINMGKVKWFQVQEAE